MENNSWIITGCSSGFGKAIAAAINAGYAVTVTARDVNSPGAIHPVTGGLFFFK
ncbi:MAG: hypothetical protein JWR23_2801 [Mucilaginibacter sp.]|nr:hypothetical protein [Mucilaginibacter sp.]